MKAPLFATPIGSSDLRGCVVAGRERFTVAQPEESVDGFSVGGLRFLVSRAIIARVDVGFSEEETALVYLKFGHTF